MCSSANRFLVSVVAAPSLALSLSLMPSPVAAVEPVDCQREQPRARDGQRPPEALLHQLVRCQWERPAAPASTAQGQVQVSIESLQLGAARPWGEPTDYGRAYLGTRVWPVTVRYVRLEHSVGHVEQVRGEGVFNCFVNVQRSWNCTYAYALPTNGARTVMASERR